MINRKEMLPLLVQVCPSFKADYEAFVEEWKEDFLGLPYYVALADFARHLIEKLESGDMDGLPAIFALIERFHLEGDSYVKEAATVGLLEALQNEDLYTDAKPSQFEPFLLPESKRWWLKVSES